MSQASAPSFMKPSSEPPPPRAKQTTKKGWRWRRFLYLGAAVVVALLLFLAFALLGVPPFEQVALAAAKPLLPHDVTGGYADVRNAAVVEADEEARSRGRHILEALAERHGLSSWKTKETLSVVAVDEWAGQSAWWPQPSQRFTHDQLLGTFTSRVRLHGGPNEGEIWGIQSWSPYLADPSPEPEWIADDHPLVPNITFYLPTLQYFNELVFRLQQAPVAVYAGVELWQGLAYHLVYVTWEEGPPTGKHDHYVLWIDEATGLLAKAHYTVRDGPSFAPLLLAVVLKAISAGTIHFDDYRPVEDVLLPHQQVVTLFGPQQAAPDPNDNYFHRLRIESAAFDRIAASELVPDPSRPPPADSKR